MKMEKWSWFAIIIAAIVAVLAWLVDRNDFIAFCEASGKFVAAPFLIVFSWLTHPVTWPVWGVILIAIIGSTVVASHNRIFQLKNLSRKILPSIFTLP